MDPYSMERWILDRHASVMRTAETRSRLEPDLPAEAVSRWLAVRLRALADRLDGEGRSWLESAPQ